MSCLSIVQDVCQRVGLAAPSSAVTSPDPMIQQILSLATKEGEWLTDQYDWQVLTVETSFITVAAQVQGQLSTICPNLKNIINDTIWNRDLRRPVFGPLAAQRYEQLQAMVMQGPWNQFIIQGNNLIFFPVPQAGQHCWFEYTTQNWCQSEAGAGQGRFAADTDVLLLREDVFKLGMEWRWKKAKGLDYAQDFVDYETMLQNAKARDGSKDVINMGDVKYDIYPGILIPSGSWPT
ncbi:hypothetical protein [Burkholderia cepacia]|uniref:hypothetical protein n=1 Tax=Burkholderia cepacia TaxID=292 RepID=UPI001CF41A9E|nr:hypothetical protein [Burkholderia cepacia]MCA8026414.1 hypothetical protein [Burkholderia cepacia]